MRPRKLLPALLGGLFMGVLSVLPIVGAANVCCCLWVVVGGVLAAWVMQQNHPLPITLGEGALVGLLAGLIGFVVMIGASIPVAYLQGSPLDGFESLLRQDGVTPEMREMLEQVGPNVLAVTVAAMVFVANLVFGTIGGLVGAAIFRTPAPPAPMPPSEPPPWAPPPVPPPAEPRSVAPEADGEREVEAGLPAADAPGTPPDERRPKAGD